MTAAKPITRPERYKQLVRQSARELRVKPSNEQAKRRATLLLARETLREALAHQLLAGSVINPDTLVKIDQLLSTNMPEPVAELPSIDVRFVDGTFTVCPRCHYTAPKPLEPVPPPE